MSNRQNRQFLRDSGLRAAARSTAAVGDISPRRIEDSSWFRRFYGLTAAIPLIPGLGLNVPLSALVSAPLLAVRRRTTQPPWFAIIVAFALLCVCAVSASAFIQGVPISNAAVGHILIFVVSLIAYRIALLDTAQASQLMAWFYLAMTFYFILFGPESTQERGIQGLWKYGIGYPVAFVAIYFLVYKAPHPGRAILALTWLGILGTFLGGRAYGLVCFAAAAIVIARTIGGRQHSIRTIVIAVTGLGLLAWLLPLALESGLLGEDAATRTVQQVESRSNILLGGRTEPPLSIAAITAKPLFGWGDIQSIDGVTISRGVNIAQALGMGNQSGYMPLWIRANGNISLHSILFGSWVEGGIAAAIFPAALVVLFIASALLARGRFAPLITLSGLQAAWTVLFSPWAVNRGVQLAVAAILAMLALVEHRAATQVPKTSDLRSPEPSSFTRWNTG